jgi:hypothetical protein
MLQEVLAPAEIVTLLLEQSLVGVTKRITILVWETMLGGIHKLVQITHLSAVEQVIITTVVLAISLLVDMLAAVCNVAVTIS